MSLEYESTLTAYHEAGHILLAEWYGGCVIFASIIPSDDIGIRSHGQTRAIWHTPVDRKKRSIQLANVALGGPVAEMIYADEQYDPQLLREWWTDWHAAGSAIQDAASRSLNERERVGQLSRMVLDLIPFFSQDEVWDRVARVADHLEAHESLEEDQLAEMRAAGLFG